MWCGVVWCGVVWCGVVWCGVVCVCMCMVHAWTHGVRGCFFSVLGVVATHTAVCAALQPNLHKNINY